jgi:hypothetical protein
MPYTWVSVGGLGYVNDPLLGKIFEIDRENPLHKKIDHEYPGVLRKPAPFQNPGYTHDTCDTCTCTWQCDEST